MRKYLAPRGSLRIFTVSGCRSGKNSNLKNKGYEKYIITNRRKIYRAYRRI